MDVKFVPRRDGSLDSVQFDGMTGCESVSSVKEALGAMQIVNPAVTFTRDCKAGLYDSISDEEYNRLLACIEHISQLWRHPNDPGGKPTYDMNPLTLLANALQEISRMDAQARAEADDEFPP